MSGLTVRVIAVTRFLGVPPELARKGIREDQDQGSDGARLIECAGRACYDSFGGRSRSSAGYHEHIKAVGHGSVTEHASISFYIEGISRGLSHELVRHRHANISQRSTRYVDESESEWVWHPLIERFGLATDQKERLSELARSVYRFLVEAIEQSLVDRDTDRATARKQARGAARGALGNALSTALVWTVNVRSLRNFLEQRASPFADAEIRLLANAIYQAAQEIIPEYLDDYRREECPDGIGYALTTEHRKL